MEILTGHRVPESQYYFRKHLDAGVRIHRRLPELVNAAAIKLRTTSWARQARDASGMVSGLAVPSSFYWQFDVVCPIQVENYYRVQQQVDDHPGLIVHLMGNTIQYNHDMYDLLTKGKEYRFVIFNRAQADEVAHLPCRTFRWPLAMDLTDRPLLPRRTRAPDEPARIGVFTRLSDQKPIEPFLYALHELNQRLPAELWVYGGGDPGIFERCIRTLSLQERVRFMGHTPDLVATLRDEQIDSCWLMSVDETVGYASIEIGSLGVPMVYWNWGHQRHDEVLAATGGVMHAFSSVLAFVDHAETLLRDPAHLADQGRRLRDHFLAHHDVGRRIRQLEDHYAEVVDQECVA
ncbi:MAG: glycosyltransferase [Myxococcota bacterium]